MPLKRKNLFLIDSLGALVSAFLLGVVLVSFENTFGMSQNVLYFLSITACILAIYSFLCYLFVKENWQPYFKILAFANLGYCSVTIGLVLYSHKELKNLGLLYFLSEVILIITLVIVELKTAFKEIEN